MSFVADTWSGARDAATLPLTADFNAATPFIDRHLSEGRGDKVAIRTVHGDVTYAELAAAVNRTGNALLAAGLNRGDRLLMIVKDCPDFFYLFWGAIKAGIVPVPLNTLLRSGDYAYMIGDSGCRGLFWSQEYAGEVEAALASLGQHPPVAMTVDAFAPRRDAASATLAAVPAGPLAECFWLYSSGSTGRPKGAVHRQRDMVVTSEFYGRRTLGVAEHDVCFSAAKLFFAYGLGNGMTFPLWAGATSVLLETRPTPASTFEIVEKFRPTIYFGVPTLYAAQLAAMEQKMPDFSSVTRCVSAGEALPGDIFRRWKEMTGLLILDGIGSTEALHIFISNTAADHKPGTSGRAVPGYEARIVDHELRPVPQGEPGQLHIRGGSTAAYYWNNAEKTAQTMLDEEWLNTGDTYCQDEDGYFHYCGRNDDMLKVGGIWCSPFEIEAKLIEHPKVLEAAVIGREDGAGLVKPEAYIVLREDVQPGRRLEEELLALCKAGLAPYKYPRAFHFVDELPKTATGKVQRFKLRQV
jgi:benzoate-CoA ligase family protein